MLPREVKKSDPVLAKDFNAVLAELRRLRQLFDAGLAGQARPLRLDQVIFGLTTDEGPESEADYEDARYWVSASKIEQIESDNETNEISFVEYVDGENYQHSIFTATNLAEIGKDLHHLPVGTPVVVLRFLDEGTPTKNRYFFWQTPKNFTLFPVDVTETSGSSGNKTTKCSFTYTANDILTGSELGTALDPEWDCRTSVGKFVAATKGSGYFDEENTFILFSVNEVPDVEGC